MSNSAQAPSLTDVRGAIYIPARAYNAYQMWAEYSGETIKRDLGYATEVNLNALRVWMSYEYWLEDPDAYEAAFEHLLSTAADRGIRILPSLFEAVGVEPTEQNRTETGLNSAYAVHSPQSNVVSDPGEWNRPREFVNWFMDRWRDDERLLAVEIHNIPGVTGDQARLRFARNMFKTAAVKRGTRPLTVGATSIKNNMYFLDLDVDVLQFHENFPTSDFAAREAIKEAELASDLLERPIWLSEWQRIRQSGSGWGDESIPEEETEPDLASMASIVRESDIDGDFFWSLMVKPAWLRPQRKKGTVNGLFHEDGAVWNLDDARAIAEDDTLTFEERQRLPEWATETPDQYI